MDKKIQRRITTHTKQSGNFKSIASFLHIRQKKTSRFISYTGLGIGILLLLCSVQMYFNIHHLLKDRQPRKNGFDFVSVTKTITNQNMGSDNRFNQEDIRELQHQSFITDAAPLNSNQFRAKASAGSIIPFSTDLFLESVKNDFIDIVPEDFTWQPGQRDVPIIFSADFLEMYNIFAPAQGLPQLSESSVKTVNIILECYGPNGIIQYQGHIVALSDRINSVLVPENFLQWANVQFGDAVSAPAARVYLKTIDANDPALLKFLEQKNYHINKDKTKFGRAKQVLQSVVGGLGFFAIMIILLAMMLFSFYLQLMISRSRENLLLLLTLGYSPLWLSKTVARKWIPAYLIIIIAALIVCSILQLLFSQLIITGGTPLPAHLHFSVYTLAVVLLFLCITVNYRLIKHLIYRL